MVPSLEVGDMLLTAVSTAAQSVRNEPVPEPTPPTVVIEPVSSTCTCVYACLLVCLLVCVSVCGLEYCIAQNFGGITFVNLANSIFQGFTLPNIQ